jgi:hypothetical protein
MKLQKHAKRKAVIQQNERKIQQAKVIIFLFNEMQEIFNEIIYFLEIIFPVATRFTNSSRSLRLTGSSYVPILTIKPSIPVIDFILTM